jgi:uncharacterized protein YlxW (UPF0749 family)
LISRQSLTARAIAPALVVGLLAFLLTVDLRAQDTAGKLTEGRRAQLAAIVAERQQRTSELEARLAQLRAQVAAIALNGGSVTLQELQSAKDRISAASGTTDVTGPGLVVRLTDAPSSDQSSSNTVDNQIQDVDIQAVVNALWAAGAEAIAVNGQRLVSTTAIRNAGGAVLVNFRVLTSPYVVSVIGDVEAMRTSFDASDIARHFRSWEQIYGLGFSVEQPGTIQIPAFGGSLHFRYAHVAQAR